MLENTHPINWWTPRAKHCLDLMLEDIDKIEWVKKCVKEAKTITKYILLTHLGNEPYEEKHWGLRGSSINGKPLHDLQ